MIETAPVANGGFTAAHIPPSAPAWLARLKSAAWDVFQSAGFPARRDEEWRMTPLASVAEQTWAPLEGTSAGFQDDDVSAWSSPEDERIVFFNGTRVAAGAAALPDGVDVIALSNNAAPFENALGRVVDGSRPFAALNAARFVDAVLIRAQRGASVERPLHLVFVHAAARPSSAHPRILIEAGDGSRLAVAETHVALGGQPLFVNPVTEIACADNASVAHIRVVAGEAPAKHIGHVAARLGRDARWSSWSVVLGGELTRVDVDATLAGEGADAALRGLYVLDGRRHADHHTLIDHAVTNGTSREIYRGVLDGRSRGVFRGRIVVRAGAQKTNAHQANDNLLLSPEALVDTKPELKIYANDVKCKHGATIGRLSADALFYLLSRGLSKDQARALLVRAFAASALEDMDDTLRRRIEARLFPGSAEAL